MDEYKRCTKNESSIMMIITLAIMFLNIVGVIIAFIAWKVYGKDSQFIKRNGLRAIDFYISFVIYELIVILLCVIKMGTYLLPVMTIIYAAILIMAIISYYKHKEFNFPLNLRILDRLGVK